jgi:hypothetical protein
MKDEETQRLFDEGQLVRAPVTPRTADGPAPAPDSGQAGPSGIYYVTVEVGDQGGWSAAVMPLLTLDQVRDLVAGGHLVKSSGEPRPISRPRPGPAPGRFVSVAGDPWMLADPGWRRKGHSTWQGMAWPLMAADPDDRVFWPLGQD